MNAIQIQYDEQYSALNLPLIQPPRAGDVGYDLYCTQNVIINPQSQARINLLFSLALPKGYYGLLQTRSSMALANVIVTGGLIDNGYRGHLIAVLANIGQITRRYTVGERIAQLIVLQENIFDLSVVQQLSPTTRGAGGFGSTGK